MSDLPKAARLMFTVYATDSDMGWIPTADIKGIPLGWGNIQVVDHDGTVRMGLHLRKLWEEVCTLFLLLSKLRIFKLLFCALKTLFKENSHKNIFWLENRSASSNNSISPFLDFF